MSSEFLQKFVVKTEAAQRAHFPALERTFAHSGAHSKSAQIGFPHLRLSSSFLVVSPAFNVFCTRKRDDLN